jgi:hypothetical protein
MILHPEYTEINIILALESQLPKLLDSNFYYESGIIPSKWQLANPPIKQLDRYQLEFTNNIRIATELKMIIFTELRSEKLPEWLEIVETIKKLVRTLPKLRYDGLGVSPATFCTVKQNGLPIEAPAIVNQIFSPRILSSQPAPHLSGTKLTYKFERNSQLRWLYLDIEDVQMKTERDSRRHSAVSFRGNLGYELFDTPTSADLLNALSEWPQDLQIYNEIVYGSFIENINS